MEHLKKFESHGMQPSPKNNSNKSLEELVDKVYDSQMVHLSSDDIKFLLRNCKNSVDRFRSRGSERLASDREAHLRFIISKLRD